MSSSMSTPVNSLPPPDSSSPPPPMVSDPVVTDVLAEMEREVADAQKASVPHHPQQPHPHPQQPHPHQPHQPQNLQQMLSTLPVYTKEQERSWVDTGKLQTAVVATVIAMLLLLPQLPNIYERFARIAFLQPYELYIRAALLALVLYIAMVRLKI